MWLFVFGLLLLMPIRPVHASYPEARLAYQTSYSQYREAVSNYQVARSEYLTYQTLVSRAQAEQSTRELLIDRHEVILRYLDMIDERIQTVSDLYLDESVRAQISGKIDVQRKWLVALEPQIQNAETLDEFVRLSGQTDKQIENIVAMGYRVHAYVLLSGLQETEASIGDLLSSTTEQVLQVRNDSELDGAQLERWLVDADQKLQLAQTTIDNAGVSITGIESKEGFDDVRLEMQRARRHQVEANQFLGEIVRNIKIQDE